MAEVKAPTVDRKELFAHNYNEHDPQHPFEGWWHSSQSLGGARFIRADLHDDLVKAADALASLILEECDAGTEFESDWDTESVAALTAYRKARGETQ